MTHLSFVLRDKFLDHIFSVLGCRQCRILWFIATLDYKKIIEITVQYCQINP